MKTLKMMTKLWLAGVMTLAAAAAHAYEKWTTNNVTYTYTVSNGAASIYNDNQVAVETSETVIEIPATLGEAQYPVTSIGENAFKECFSLTSVTIPASVTNIGNSAFFSCTNLTSVTIPDSVTSIGGGAFGCCSSLTSVTIPDSVTSIGDWAFFWCFDLMSVTISDYVTSIGEYVFNGCTNLTSVTIPDSVTSIGKYAFSACLGLTSVTIPDSVTSIGDYAFSACPGLTSVTIPDSVTYIGNEAFEYCSGLTSVMIGKGVTNIGEKAFRLCNNLASVTMRGAEPSVGYDAFSSIGDGCIARLPRSGYSIVDGKWQGMVAEIACWEETIDGVVWTYTYDSDGVAFLGGGSGISQQAVPQSTSGAIVIPSTIGGYPVKNIASYAFYGCTNLTSVTIPDSVTSIGEHAFRGCTSLEDVGIPSGPIRAGEGVFDDFLLYRKLFAGGGSGSAAATGEVALTVTNVVVHYVTTAAASEAVKPSEDVGFVNVIAEVGAGAAVAIPSDWAVQYGEAFTEKFGSDFTAAITKKSGKRDGAGNAMFVWQDFVAGTDPTDENDKFTASITFDADGKPLIAYSPEFSDAAEAEKRKYTTYGKVKLTDKEWTDVPDGEEANYNFFKVTVEMR